MNSIGFKIHYVHTKKLGPIIIYEFGNAVDEYHPGHCVFYAGELFLIVDIDVETLQDAVKSIEQNGTDIFEPVEIEHHGWSVNIIGG